MEIKKTVVVWDWSIRLFHWLLVLLVSLLYITGNYLFFPAHMYLGIAVMTLFFFRILIGFFGSQESKFISFIKHPSIVLNYIRGKYTHQGLGHNPIGGYSVLSFILIFLIMIISGLFCAVEDDYIYGPLSIFVSSEINDSFHSIHVVFSKILLFAIALHVIAIFYYLFKKNNLIKPMITGKKSIDTIQQKIEQAPSVRLIFLLLLSLVYGMSCMYLFFIVL
ncbi:MAG: cytochrome b/b6 domain-containing protein [Methylacidiphilales bacterium]|nr:cytochrome b/b6 domain-containing protein [Candidatus Methylacidiphilales bacterium]